MGALVGRLSKSSIDRQFQDQVRGMLKPGTSALFLMLEKVTPDKAVEAMSRYGGTVLKTSLCPRRMRRNSRTPCTGDRRLPGSRTGDGPPGQGTALRPRGMTFREVSPRSCESRGRLTQVWMGGCDD